MKEYLKTQPVRTAREILLYRLHMVNIPMNYKNSWVETVCPVCSEENGTTEHYFLCEKTESLRKIWDISTLDEETPSKMELIAKYFQDVQKLVEPKWKMLTQSRIPDVKPSVNIYQ